MAPPLKLQPLEDWARERVINIFHTPNEAEMLKEIEKTFAPQVESTLNGNPMTREMVDKLLTGMRPSPDAQLRLEWKQMVAAPRDASQRSGAVGGFYVVYGLRKEHPASGHMTPFVRRKVVMAVVESQSDDLSIDSRRFISFRATANDFPEEEVAHL